MKVKCYVCRYEAIEAEISDEFAKLAVPRPWENGFITDADYDNCIKAVEQATGLPFGDVDCPEAYIVGVHSIENGEVLMEW